MLHLAFPKVTCDGFQISHIYCMVKVKLNSHSGNSLFKAKERLCSWLKENNINRW